jgi:hypothetical protein
MATNPDRRSEPREPNGAARTESLIVPPEIASARAQDRAQETAKQASIEARSAVQAATDAAAQVSQAVSSVIHHAAIEGREAAAEGARHAAEAAAPAADASFFEGRRLVETSARITDLYRTASDETAGDLQALTSSYARLGQGMLRMQHTYFDLLQKALDQGKHRPQDLLRCRSLAEVAEVQRDLYLETVGFMMDSSTKLLQMAGEVLQGAKLPLDTRSHLRHGAQ